MKILCLFLILSIVCLVQSFPQGLIPTLMNLLTGTADVYDPSDSRQVIVKKMAIMVEGRNDMELDLTADQSELKNFIFRIKEGVHYRIRIDFIVQRNIINGLEYVQKTSRKGIPVDTTTHMVGSYGPKMTIQSYTTPPEEAPSGLLYLGLYSVKSLFTDDHKNIHLKWEWKYEIRKNW